MNIITLGYCCKKSKQNHANAQLAAKNCGILTDVTNIADMSQIMQYGVMSTPALLIDNKVVSYGRLLSVEQIEKLIKSKSN